MAFATQVKPNPNIPTLTPGDTVRVHVKVVEGDRSRLQVFQGVIIKVRGGGINSNFTVRRVAYGVGVERTFPTHSPLVDRVEVIRKGKVRRARLYYLRGLSGRAARIKEKRMAELAPELVGEEAEAEAVEEAPVAEAPQPAATAEAPTAETPTAEIEAAPEAPKAEEPPKQE